MPPLWCNTLLQCGGGGLPLGLMMNSTEDELASGGEVFLSSCGVLAGTGRFVSPPFLWWWLVLFIKALVLSSNSEREGIQQQPI